MNHQKVSLSPGLYFLATPIGTARDITLRALDILASADVIAAEDTRSLRHLMEIHGVPLEGRRIVAYHDHSGDVTRGRLLAALGEGRSVAYASEAGMPLIADPGYDLSRAASEAGFLVTVAPGASAALAALTLGGLPTDAFFFAGFLPNASQARRTRLEALRDIPGTLVFYESPKRATASLADMAEVLGGERPAALCRELTKKFEEVRRGSLAELAEQAAEDPPRGEIVILVDRGHLPTVSASDIENDLRAALEDHSVRDAADFVARMHGQKRREVYQLALKLAKR
ncbi:16S rRNA (cytidine(1402)-2'-O)-methyltransferase [Antarcticimicrobium sediminis]|uniref:Ribosomal RNA small subunit methyltransferase I n=1 Tax=Antarcticimicrobium sediminis TaxID=2546227 RepID=A0A4V2Z8A3_9RHOB|nr:16S rRNA (cytidine(1402)-2'-O)-methyltransferase [Antarcticimicrobium sediminis]TDE39596.1 16S rRNA (cytidine(1402)-2'-O)-methyltransferase [Antarcticimicrobium sediminis]